jgi:mycothiol system anti-sigma-R factor
MTCEEAQELITALVDRELANGERASLDSHLQLCPHCKTILEQEELVKRTVRERAERLRAPNELRARILSDPRIVPKQNRTRRQSFWPLPRRARPALAAAAILAVVLPAVLFFQSTPEPLAAAALESYDRYRSGELGVSKTENPQEIVEQLTRSVNARFHPMGYDLTARGLRPVAGLMREIDGRKVLIAIYQGEGGTLFCYTFIGSEKDAPRHAARFYDADKRMNFYAFSRDGLNAVLHREGKIICILAAEMPMEELLSLAKSKAKSS